MCQPLNGSWKECLANDAYMAEERVSSNLQLRSADNTAVRPSSWQTAFIDKGVNEEAAKLKRHRFVAISISALLATILLGFLFDNFRGRMPLKYWLGACLIWLLTSLQILVAFGMRDNAVK